MKRAVIQKKSIKEVSGVVRGREKRQEEGWQESQSLRKLSKGGVVHGVLAGCNREALDEKGWRQLL